MNHRHSRQRLCCKKGRAVIVTPRRRLIIVRAVIAEIHLWSVHLFNLQVLLSKLLSYMRDFCFLISPAIQVQLDTLVVGASIRFVFGIIWLLERRRRRRRRWRTEPGLLFLVWRCCFYRQLGILCIHNVHLKEDGSTTMISNNYGMDPL